MEKEIKEKIHKRIEEMVRDETVNKTKLRFIKMINMKEKNT